MPTEDEDVLVVTGPENDEQENTPVQAQSPDEEEDEF